ncbi:putative glycoside hydrolase [Nocardioides sp.]|uniref:putative glycoside hydrolase n=1 Tax=Nocardioides sp. TaxID=35761 RepID=UPI003563AA5E
MTSIRGSVRPEQGWTAALRKALFAAPLLAVLSVTAVSGATSSAQAAAAPVAATPQSSSAAAPGVNKSAGVLALDWGDIDSTPEAGKGNYVVINPWEYDRIPQMKKDNPDVKVLMYKDVSATVKRACKNDACTVDNDILPTGVGYHWAMKHRPRWFLRDNDNKIIEWSDWAGLYPMNIKKRGYQRHWGRNVLRELRRHDWDGVMMDDVLTYLSHDTVGNKVPRQIPTDRAMYNATERFLKKVAVRIKRKGYMAVPNVTIEWDNWHSTLTDWTRYVSGWENEYFVKWGLSKRDRFHGADWEWKMRMAEWCADRNVPLLAITYSTLDDTAAQIYHRATWLLTWNGRTGSSIFVPEEDWTNHWIPTPTVEIGDPAGDRFVVGSSGVHRRNYTDGVVLVNPTRESQTVELGASYRTLGGRSTDRVTLAPMSGEILRK